MKHNSRTRVIGKNVILVPYRRIHVPKYHCWMQSAELQELTASEPLSEDEEFEMQQSWFHDENKCTFIVLDRKTFEESLDEVTAMIGDTNLYLTKDNGNVIGETGIMIAEKSARGKGWGKEAILLMLHYGAKELKIQKYIAKISMSNTTSIKMFKNLGFQLESESRIFEETTLSVEVSQNWLPWLEQQTQHCVVESETDCADNPSA